MSKLSTLLFLSSTGIDDGDKWGEIGRQINTRVEFGDSWNDDLIVMIHQNYVDLFGLFD